MTVVHHYSGALRSKMAGSCCKWIVILVCPPNSSGLLYYLFGFVVSYTHTHTQCRHHHHQNTLVNINRPRKHNSHWGENVIFFLFFFLHIHTHTHTYALLCFFIYLACGSIINFGENIPKVISEIVLLNWAKFLWHLLGFKFSPFFSLIPSNVTDVFLCYLSLQSNCCGLFFVWGNGRV